MNYVPDIIMLILCANVAWLVTFGMKDYLNRLRDSDWELKVIDRNIKGIFLTLGLEAIMLLLMVLRP